LISFNVGSNSGTLLSPSTVLDISNVTIDRSDSNNLKNLSNVPTITIIDFTEVIPISNATPDAPSSNVLS
jgi:hypothetical protein